MAVDAYDKGVVISENDAKYNFDKQSLRNQIQNGGRNSLMSVIHDGIVGNFKMIDNPVVAENLQKYREGSLSISGLTDVVVDTYMDAVVENSVQGKAAKDKAADEKYYRTLKQQKGLSQVKTGKVYDIRSSQVKVGKNIYDQALKDGQLVYRLSMTPNAFKTAQELGFKEQTENPFIPTETKEEE